MRERTIENAKITGTKISMEDHGCLTFDLVVEGKGWGCCIGGYAIGHGYLNSDYWDATGAGLVAMMKIMNTVGVSKWEDLKGKHIRVESEGWGKIIVHNEFYQPSVLYDKLLSLCSELHENPHHSLTIGNHMLQAGTYLVKHNALDYLALAGFYHDCGKGFCKTFTNMKGEVTPIAHYYSHENVGAYLYLTYCYNDPIDLHIANLIQHHMDFFRGEKYLQRVADRFGEEFMRDLTFLHEADINAH